MNKLSAKISPSSDPGVLAVTLHVPAPASEKESLEESLVQDEDDEGRPYKPSCARFPFRAIRRVTCGLVLASCMAVSWAWGTHNAKETLTRHPTPLFIAWFCTIWNILFFPVYYLCHLLTEQQKQFPSTEFRTCSGFLGEELTVRVVLKGAAPFSVLWAVSVYLYLLALCRISKVDVSAVLCCSQAFVFLLSWIGLKDRFMGVRIVAVILSITGIVLLAYGDGFHSDSITGVALGVGSASTSALFKVLFRKCIGTVEPGPVSVLLSCVGLCGFFLHSWVCLLLYFTHDEFWTPSQQMSWDKLCVMASLLLVFNVLVNLGGMFSYPSLNSLGILLTIPASAAVDMFVTETLQMSHVRAAAAGIISAGFLLLQLPERWDESSVRWLSSLWHGNWREETLLVEEAFMDTSAPAKAKAKPTAVTFT